MTGQTRTDEPSRIFLANRMRGTRDVSNCSFEIVYEEIFEMGRRLETNGLLGRTGKALRRLLLRSTFLRFGDRRRRRRLSWWGGGGSGRSFWRARGGRLLGSWGGSLPW